MSHLTGQGQIQIWKEKKVWGRSEFELKGSWSPNSLSPPFPCNAHAVASGLGRGRQLLLLGHSQGETLASGYPCKWQSGR